MPTFDYVAKQGECLDAVVFRLFGNEHGITEHILSTNKGLAKIAHDLPIGTIIKMPIKTTNSVKEIKQVELWD